MAQVTVKINGYAYTLGCEDGQEQHLEAMAEQVEGRIDSIKSLGAQTGGEARLLVLAALLMADELHDLKVEQGQLQAQLQTQGQIIGGQGGGQGGNQAKAKSDRQLAHSLARLADRAEEIAATMGSA